MFNPHDLVPLAQAIGACLSATQLRRPSIKLPLKTPPNETCAAHFVGPGMPEEECAGQRHARILTVAAYLQQTPRRSRGAGFCRLAHGQASGETNRAASCSHRGPCRRGWTSWCKSGCTRAPSKLCRKKKARRATVMPFAQTFEAPHGRFQGRHNYATAIAREKPIGACQTRDLRGRRRTFWERGSQPLRRSTPPALHRAALPPPRAALGPRPGPSESALANRAAGSRRCVRPPPSCRRPEGPAPWPANARAPYR
jgi:hypothetical protein